MKTIVLHGNDTNKSYERLQKFISEARKRGWKITDFSIQEIENQSLFGEECFYLLYDYNVLLDKQSLPLRGKKTVEKLKKYAGNLIVYNTGKIPAPTLKSLNADKTELFELPQILWKFLDNITIKGLHEIIKTQPLEYIFAMIAWKLKQNYLKNPNEKNANLINELAIIDVKSKTTNTKLLTLLDLFIVKHLQ